MSRGARFLATGAATLATACAALVGLEPIRILEDDAGTADVTVDEPSLADRIVDDPDAGDATARCDDASDFCDDFERTAPLQGSWSGFGMVSNGTIGLEAGTALFELRSQDAAAMTVPSAIFFLDTPWSSNDAGNRPRVRIRFRARVEICPPPGDTYVAMAGVGLGGTSVNLDIQDQAGSCVAFVEEILYLDGGGASFRYSPPLLVPVGTWADYELELPETPKITAGVAIMRVGSDTHTFSLTDAPGAASYYQIFGLAQGQYRGSNARVRYEIVRVEYVD